jgi:hypothetical protein
MEKDKNTIDVNIPGLGIRTGTPKQWRMFLSVIDSAPELKGLSPTRKKFIREYVIKSLADAGEGTNVRAVGFLEFKWRWFVLGLKRNIKTFIRRLLP